MRTRLVSAGLWFLASACTVPGSSPPTQPSQQSEGRIVVVYASATIDPNIAIWNPRGIDAGTHGMGSRGSAHT
jgi:hypothetical protein